MSADVLVRVTAPHFCCGIVFVGRVVTEAAPILNNRRFSMVGWDADRVRAYVDAKGWHAERVA